MILIGKDEQEILRFKKHWGHLLIPFVAGLLTGGILFLWFFYRLARHLSDEIVLTNQKFHVSVGVISKDVISTPLSKINNVSYAQSIVGRIFGYGTIYVQSAATFGASGYTGIVDPVRAKTEIEQAIANQTTKVTIA